MMKKLLLLLAISLMAGSSMAAVHNVFGYDWTTNPDATGDTYVKNNEDSISLFCDYVSVGFITTQGLDISVGDTVSYDRFISGGAYMSWYRSGALDAGGVALDFYNEFTGDWDDPSNGIEGLATYSTALGAWTPLAPATDATGVHFDFFYDSATSYVMTVSDTVTGAIIASAPGAIAVDNPAATIDTIDGWLFAEYVGDYEIRIDNFTVTPEPATMAILGLGGLFLRRKR